MNQLNDFISYIGSSDSNGSLLKQLLLTAALGFGALVALRQFISLLNSFYYKFPKTVDNKLFKKRIQFIDYLKENHAECLKELLKNYPDDCSVTLNGNFSFRSKKVVILNSRNAVKKFSSALENSQAISNRPKNFLLKLISKNYLGSFFRLSDDNLLFARKSTLSGLHQLIGDGVELENNLSTEVNELIKFISNSIESSDQKSLVFENAYIHLQQYSTNIIATIGLGIRFPYDLDPNSAIKSQINKISEIFTSLNIFEIEKFRCIDQYLNKETFKFVNDRFESIYGFLTGAINGYKANYDEKKLKTFADFAIGKHIELSKNSKLKPSECYSEDDILVQVFTLIMAGADSIGFTLAWSFYYLSQNQNVQEKIFKEIESAVGGETYIKYSQRSHYTYTCACVNEILRLSAIQSLILRATLKDVKIGDYNLPADTTVLINNFAINRDEKYWTNPDEFNPNRWIGDDGKLISNPDGFMAFGASPRSCLGETLGRNVVFIAIANLISKFKLDYVSNEGEDQNGVLGVFRRPSKYNLKFTMRK